MAKRSSYWLVVNTAREVFNLDLSQARTFYARFADAMTDRGFRDGIARGVDLDRHPRIAKRIADFLQAELPEIPEDVEWEGTVLYDA